MKHSREQEMRKMDRRTFCKNSALLGAAVYSASVLGWPSLVGAQDAAALPDLVAIRNGEPDVMFDQAIAALGGIERFVKAGQTVVVKPNIGWDRAPETGADTNPLLVKRIVEQCVKAGAKQVYVFDHVISNYIQDKTYAISGIEEAAKAGGAVVAPGNDVKYYQDVTIPGAVKLTDVKVHHLIAEADVLINVPVLKHHFASRLTIAMKNLMGVVWDREAYHGKGLHQCIADFCLHRKPDLNVVDAYAVTMNNGPQRARAEDLTLMKSLLISPDIVAVDAAAALLWGAKPEEIAHIKLGHDLKIGNMNIQELNVKKIAL